MACLRPDPARSATCREAQSRHTLFVLRRVGGRVEDPPPRVNRLDSVSGLILMRGTLRHPSCCPCVSSCDTMMGKRRRHCCAWSSSTAQLLPPACRPGPGGAAACEPIGVLYAHSRRTASIAKPRAQPGGLSAPRARCARIAAMVREADDRDRGRRLPVRQLWPFGGGPSANDSTGRERQAGRCRRRRSPR